MRLLPVASAPTLTTLSVLALAACQTTGTAPTPADRATVQPASQPSLQASPQASPMRPATVELAPNPPASTGIPGATDDGLVEKAAQTMVKTTAAVLPGAATPTEGDFQENRALKAGFRQIKDAELRGLVSGHAYAYDHPKGARITLSYAPDGTATGKWVHPAGLSGDFQEKWVIRGGEALCGISDEGVKCGTLFRKDDLLVKIYDSGRVDKLDPIQNLATK